MYREQIVKYPNRNFPDYPRYDFGYQSMHFNLKQKKEKLKPTQIMMAVTINSRRYRIYIRYKVEPAFWDSKNGRCRTDDLLSPRVRARMERLNRTLEELRRRLDIADMHAAEQGRVLAIEDLRNIVKTCDHKDASLLGESSRANAPYYLGGSGSEPAPIPVLRSIADSFESDISDKGGKGAASSRKSYLYCCQRLEEYAVEKHIEFGSFAQLDRSFYFGFSQWLNSRSYSRGGKQMQYSAATVQNTLRCISNLHRKAFEAGITSVPECRCSAFHYNIGESGGKVYLSESELRRLGGLTSLSKSEEQVRDMFLLAAYTGLRISDINQLNEAVISGGTIRLFQQKTHGYVEIPLLKEIAGIVSKYTNRIQGFPSINSSTANKTIKILCRQAGIDALTPVNEFRGGRAVSKNCPKYELVSFHTARRSCVTNLFRRGYSPNHLMTMSGHKSVSSFQRYIRTNREELASDFIRELKKQKAI